MCSFYNLKTNHHQILEWSGVEPPEDFPTTVAAKQLGLGLKLDSDGNRTLEPMRFGLIPANAKSADQYKPAYNNARYENLDKWPWRLSRSNRCVVPLTSFREPCYWGPTAGSMVHFYSPDDPILGVAALYNGPSMTMVMRPASQFIMDHGHQRQPLLIHPDGFDGWMNGGALLVHEPDFAYTDEIKMKPGWEKRQPAALKKREAELESILDNGPLGI